MLPSQRNYQEPCLIGESFRVPRELSTIHPLISGTVRIGGFITASHCASSLFRTFELRSSKKQADGIMKASWPEKFQGPSSATVRSELTSSLLQKKGYIRWCNVRFRWPSQAFRECASALRLCNDWHHAALGNLASLGTSEGGNLFHPLVLWFDI